VPNFEEFGFKVGPSVFGVKIFRVQLCLEMEVLRCRLGWELKIDIHICNKRGTSLETKLITQQLRC